ncbi:MAG: phosphoenolpyruvate carboxykinase domain-containing protein, partial [Actinomycetota bacterium]
SRVLAWIFERCDGTADAVDTPIGRLPTTDGLQLDGSGLTPADLQLLLNVDRDAWRDELASIEEHLAQFRPKLPKQLDEQLHALTERLDSSA